MWTGTGILEMVEVPDTQSTTSVQEQSKDCCSVTATMIQCQESTVMILEYTATKV